jgi:hypothetical protein
VVLFLVKIFKQYHVFNYRSFLNFLFFCCFQRFNRRFVKPSGNSSITKYFVSNNSLTLMIVPAMPLPYSDWILKGNGLKTHSKYPKIRWFSIIQIFTAFVWI